MPDEFLVQIWIIFTVFSFFLYAAIITWVIFNKEYSNNHRNSYLPVIDDMSDEELQKLGINRHEQRVIRKNR